MSDSPVPLIRETSQLEESDISDKLKGMLTTVPAATVKTPLDAVEEELSRISSNAVNDDLVRSIVLTYHGYKEEANEVLQRYMVEHNYLASAYLNAVPLHDKDDKNVEVGSLTAGGSCNEK